MDFDVLTTAQDHLGTRARERETDRQTNTDIHTYTDTDRHRHTERQGETETDIERDREKEIYRETVRDSERQLEPLTEMRSATQTLIINLV